MAERKEVWITGIGILSSLGEGLEAHWDALNAKLVNVDDKRFAPYIVHPLAQLSNLLAGNIAIVHGVCGTSRTFMGEETSSIDAARIAVARIESGQSDIALIGAAYNGERPDLLILYEFGDFNLTDKYEPVW